jgi:hypothetical protein
MGATQQARDAIREHLLLLARRYVWWKDPHDALRDRHHLIGQVMTLGTLEDCVWLEEVLGREELAAAVKEPAIGVFTPRAWHYWHYRLGLAETECDIPALPTRRYAAWTSG